MTTRIAQPVSPIAARLLSLVAPVHASEGRLIGKLFLHGFALLFAFYLLRPLRESLLLTQDNVETRAYLVAAVALLQIVAVPLYGLLLRRSGTRRAQLIVLALYAFSSLGFLCALLAGARPGLLFFMWLGVASILVLSQFWSCAADLIGNRRGRRLLPVLVAGTGLGSVTGAWSAELLLLAGGPAAPLALATVALFIALCLSLDQRQPPAPEPGPAQDDTRDSAKNPRRIAVPPDCRSSFQIICSDRYLLLIAVFVILCNCIGAIGDFLLADAVAIALEIIPEGADRDGDIVRLGSFYARLYGWVALLGLGLQVFFVARLLRVAGVARATMAMPLLMLFGYGLFALAPVLSLLQVVKVMEQGCNYSLYNTVRQALFLPLPAKLRQTGMTAIETCCWRSGDLLHGLLVYGGTHWLNWQSSDFAWLNTALAALLLLLTIPLGRRYLALQGLAPEQNEATPPPAAVSGTAA